MNKQIKKMSKQRQEYLKFKPFADDLRKAESWCELDGVLNRYQTVKNLYKMGYHKQSEGTVEVVRCKDCVYFKQSVSALFPHASAFVCDCPYGLQKNVNENDFCCHGARG